MHNTKGLVSVTVAGMLALAACTGDSRSDQTPPAGEGSTGGGAAQAVDPDREAPAVPIEGAVAGGTVTVLSGPTRSLTMDPSEVYDDDLQTILSGLVTRTLTQYVYDPAQESMVLVPDLATDTGTPNEDFTEWTFTIREGVRFEDGTEVTADDVAFGIKRSFDKQAFRQGPSYSRDNFLDGKHYRGPYRSGTDYAGVVVEGDTLTLKMDHPFAEMPYYAAFPAIGPIPEGNSDPAEYWRHPMATGPYKFADFDPGTCSSKAEHCAAALTLVRNDQWDPDTDPGRHAYPDRYEFDFAATADRIDATVLANTDAARTVLSMEEAQADSLGRAEELDRVSSGPGRCTFFWSPDYRTITDIRVREAIGYAFPYQQAAAPPDDYVFGVNFVPGTSVLLPGTPGRQDYQVLDTEPGRTDPDKARALLRQAGYAPGEYTLSWPYIDDSFGRPRSETVAHALEAAGFDTEPFRTSNGSDMDAVLHDPDAPVNLRQGGWCPDWPTGSSWLPPVFRSENEGGSNVAFFSEPVVDAEIERITRLPLYQQAAGWGELDRSIMTDYYPVVVTGYQVTNMLHGPGIGGMNMDNVKTMPTWKDLHILR